MDLQCEVLVEGGVRAEGARSSTRAHPAQRLAAEHRCGLRVATELNAHRVCWGGEQDAGVARSRWAGPRSRGARTAQGGQSRSHSREVHSEASTVPVRAGSSAKGGTQPLSGRPSCRSQQGILAPPRMTGIQLCRP
jgi:hypothetical protein